MQKDAGRCSYVRTAVVTQQGKKLAELFAAYEQQVSKAAQELFGQFFRRLHVYQPPKEGEKT